MSEKPYTLPPMGEQSKFNKAKAVVVVIAVTIGLLMVMKIFKPEIEKKEAVNIVSSVETISVQAIDFTPPITTEGMVLPQTKINISAEVAGKVVFVADNFKNGGAFAKDEVLLKIDPVDYQLAITRAQANISSQQANLDLQQAKSDLAKKDWVKYGKKGKPNALNLNIPQVDSAKAALLGAKADLKLAQRNLDKTIVTAPFDGVMLSKGSDLGQFVSMGVALASVASTEVAEIRVSLSDEQLIMSGLVNFDQTQNVSVVITSEEIGSQQWQGKLASIEAQRDARTLFNYAIIEVILPFTQNVSALRFNTFVDVQFQGQTLESVYPISRSYMMLENKLKLLDSQSKLLIKSVEVVYSDDESFYVSGGLKDGDQVITTQLPGIKPGSLLNVVNQQEK